MARHAFDLHRSTDPMTSLSLPRTRRLPRIPRPRRTRPLAILVASLLVVGASQVATVLQPRPTPNEAVSPEGATTTVPGPANPPDAPVGTGPSSLSQIDHAIAAWTTNLSANDRDFLSASNLGLLYEARARLSGDVGDYRRAEEAADRSLAIEPGQLGVEALHARLRLATHDFSVALAEAERIDRTAPDQPA